MRKIVLVSQVFHPDDQATSQLLSGLFEKLADHGGQIQVLAGGPSISGQNSRSEVWCGIGIRRGGFRVNSKRNLFSRALGYASYCVWLIWRLLLFTPAGARVLVVTNPPFAPVLVHWCSLLRGWRYDVLLHDIYPEGLVAVGKLHRHSAITRLWQIFNRAALASAQIVLVLGRDMARFIKVHYHVPPGKITYMPNWSPYASEGRRPAETTILWQQLHLQGNFVVQYSGNMGLCHDLECIVRAADLLRTDPQIQFLMIGGGMRKNRAEQLGRELGLTNIRWLAYQPKEQLFDSLACCHVALISQRAGLAGLAVPSKLYGILASGRAVLAQVPADSEVALVVEEERCGRTIAPGDAPALAAAIRLLAADIPETERMGTRAFQAYQEKYTLGRAVCTYEARLKGEVACETPTL